MQLLGDDFFSSVAHATNCNAVLKSPPTNPDPGLPYATSDPHWHVDTADDIKAFVGINICMGLKEMSEYSDYWNTSPVLNDPFISSVMSKRRYEKQDIRQVDDNGWRIVSRRRSTQERGTLSMREMGRG